MQERIPYPIKGSVGRKGVECFWHKVVTGAAGAITVASSDVEADSGMTVVKTAAQVGRYTITLCPGGGAGRPYKKFLKGGCTIIGPDSANYGANTAGIHWIYRDDDISPGGANDGTVELQFLTRGGATIDDAELPNNTSFIVEIWVEKGM